LSPRVTAELGIPSLKGGAEFVIEDLHADTGAGMTCEIATKGVSERLKQ
jgi:hypothetical protein